MAVQARLGQGAICAVFPALIARPCGRVPRSNGQAMPSENAQPAGASSSRPAMRSFARFSLVRLLGKSERTMAWLVNDPRSGADLMLVLPRVQCRDPAAARQWHDAVKKAARLQHPNLLPAVEIGAHEHWPYVAYDPAGLATLSDRMGRSGLPPPDSVALLSQVLEGLAYAHEAGAAHHDLQPYLVLVSDHGHVRVAGLEVAQAYAGHEVDPRGSGAGPGTLQAQRHAGERDVLSVGLLLHQALTGQPALDDADTGRVIRRLPPSGHDLVRLPWTTPRPVPEVLRAIANRATDRQERHRYHSARTMWRALQGWLTSDENTDVGPLALLIDRIGSAGMLPGSPGGPERAARLALMDRQRTNELAAVVIEDLALSFELLRLVNSAQVRGAQVAGSGPVLTVRRALAMLGLDNVRRSALALRNWPGPLAEPAAAELSRLMARTRRAARVAIGLRPAGYDAEAVAVITMLQNLGRLVVNYHFADEAQQIRRLMAPMPPDRPGEAEHPGMQEEAAAFSVLGVDIESIGHALARRWGLDDTVLHVIRRLPPAAPVRTPENDNDILRAVASCSNEVVDAQALPATHQAQALHRVGQRYARALHLAPKDLQAAIQAAATSTLADLLRDADGNAMYSPADHEADTTGARS